MQYRPLGKSGLRVSAVAMGCWAIAGQSVWGSQDEHEALAAIGASLDAGVTLFDTAEGYGESERLLARGLGTRRDEALIASKVSAENLAPDKIRASCENSLRALQTEQVDLYQMHWPPRDTALDDAVSTLRDLQAEGKIRIWGVSNFGSGDLDDLATVGNSGCASNQVIYNLLTRAIEFDVLPRCEKAGIGILAYSPLAQGLLTGKFASADDVPPGRARTRHFRGNRPQARHGEAGHEAETFAAIAEVKRLCADANLDMGDVSLAWCLTQGATSVIAGARNAEQARTNARAADVVLPPELVSALNRATDALKSALGPNLDLWDGAANARSR